MKPILFSCLLAAILLGCSESPCRVRELPVTTEKGVELSLRVLGSGLLTSTSKGERIESGTDTHGNAIYGHPRGRPHLTKTSRIPLQIGNGFGFLVLLPEIPPDDVLPVMVVAGLPQPAARNGTATNVIEATHRFGHDFSGRVLALKWAFRAESPQYHLPGKWSYTLRNSGHELVRQSFDVMDTVKRYRNQTEDGTGEPMR